MVTNTKVLAGAGLLAAYIGWIRRCGSRRIGTLVVSSATRTELTFPRPDGERQVGFSLRVLVVNVANCSEKKRYFGAGEHQFCLRNRPRVHRAQPDRCKAME